MAKTSDPISLNGNEKQNAWAVVTFLQRCPLQWLNPRINNNNTELYRKQNRKMQRNIKKKKKSLK